MKVDEFEEIRNYGIKKLRIIAKKIGVKAPTTLSKENLLDEIKDILTNEKEPYFSKINKTKSLTINDSEFNKPISFFDINSRDSIFNDTKLNDNIMFSVFTNNEQPSTNIIEGYYRNDNGDYGIIDDISTNIIKSHSIPVNLVKAYNLKCGDYVKAKLVFNNTFKINIVKEIISINGLKGKILINDDFDNLKSIVSDKAISFGGTFTKNVCYGTRNLIKVKENRYTLLKNYLKIFSNCKKFDKKYFLIINDAPEIISLITDHNSIIFPLTKSYLNNLLEFKLIINNMKRNVENGNDVLFVIMSTTMLEKFLVENFKSLGSNLEQAKMQTFSYIRELFYLGRNLEKSGSVTVFACDDQNETNYEFLVNNVF